MDDNQPQRIEASFRHGSMTAVSLLAGFSLTYLTSWAAEPGSWEIVDLVALAILVIGLFGQLTALAIMLQPESLLLAVYRRAIRFFLAGVCLVAIGTVITLIAEAADPGDGPQHPRPVIDLNRE